MADVMLSTFDNPYDPFTQYDQWYEYDTSKGYHSSSFLGRVVVSSPELTEQDQDLAIEEAIDEIVRENVLGIYIKVKKDSEKLDED